MENARRWSGYVCPDCRFVFRIPRDHDGQGIVCPSCRRLLKIPTLSDITPPLMAPVKQEIPLDIDPEAKPKGTNKRRRKKAGAVVAHDWEQAPATPRMRRGEKTKMRKMLMLGGFLFSVIVASITVPMIMKAPQVVAKKTVDPKSKPVDQESAGLHIDEATILAQAEPLVRKFMAATRVEDVMGLVRNPETAESRMRTLYQDGQIPTLGLTTFNVNGGLTIDGDFVSVPVLTSQHEDKTVNIEITPQGMKIDWESWVGWSDIPWKEFQSTQPTTRHVFRVYLSSVEYYNFEFLDEKKWQSYSLRSPDSTDTFYGYVEKGSALDNHLRPNQDENNLPVTLGLKFPLNPKNNTQVEIVDLVTEGWIEKKERP
jgi:hypothetical protein